jgi:membrane associated rhomboid family serine protease
MKLLKGKSDGNIALVSVTAIALYGLGIALALQSNAAGNIFGVLAIVTCIYGLVRYWTEPKTPFVVISRVAFCVILINIFGSVFWTIVDFPFSPELP